MAQRVAVVTGSNKGIGFAIVKGLCSHFQGDVFLTARDESRGKAAVKELEKLGLSPRFHLLDIESTDSIKTLATFLKEKYGGLDVLVNNAAIAYKNESTAPFSEQALNTIKVNYFATLSVCHELFPLLRPHARVVNISSSSGALSRLPQGKVFEELKKSKTCLAEEELSQLMNQFVEEAAKGTHAVRWGNSAYIVSKVGVSALTFIQDRKFRKDEREDIVINSVHPGYVDTDMTSHKGPLTIEQGAEAPVYLSLLPPNVKEPRGQYVWNDKKIADWA